MTDFLATPHPLLLLLGLGVAKKAVILSAGYLYGWKRIYRHLMRVNKFCFEDDKEAQIIVRDSIQDILRFPRTTGKTLNESHVKKVLDKYFAEYYDNFWKD